MGVVKPCPSRWGYIPLWAIVYPHSWHGSPGDINSSFVQRVEYLLIGVSYCLRIAHTGNLCYNTQWYFLPCPLTPHAPLFWLIYMLFLVYLIVSFLGQGLFCYMSVRCHNSGQLQLYLSFMVQQGHPPSVFCQVSWVEIPVSLPPNQGITRLHSSVPIHTVLFPSKA